MARECTLHLYKEKAYKNFEAVRVAINENGLIYVRDLLKRYRLSELRVIRGGRDKGAVLQQDDHGFNVIYTFDDGQTYNLRQLPDENFDEEVTFSDVTLEEVLNDFQLELESAPSWRDDDVSLAVEPPTELFSSLSTIARWNTLRCENSRRSVISLYLAYALEVAQPTGRTTISEEMQVKAVREVNGIRRRYSGPVDYAIGHSQKGDKLPNDCALLVAEAKTPGEFRGALKQVLS